VKTALPLPEVYALLEPGPVLLLSTAHRSRRNVMTMSWHSMLEFEPPRVGCVVAPGSLSHRLLRASGEGVLNIPTEKIADKVAAPLLDACFASLECKVVDTGMLRKYAFSVLEVVAAWVDRKVKNPRTLHHRGFGNFMVAGKTIRLPSEMR
jgi:flavin reductase (DIM6/NTAB) family NADH-FMN oxidoreductase RutF